MSKQLKLSSTTANLLETLAENSRLSYIEKVGESFAALMAAKRGEIHITITSAEVCC